MARGIVKKHRGNLLACTFTGFDEKLSSLFSETNHTSFRGVKCQRAELMIFSELRPEHPANIWINSSPQTKVV